VEAIEIGHHQVSVSSRLSHIYLNTHRPTALYATTLTSFTFWVVAWTPGQPTWIVYLQVVLHCCLVLQWCNFLYYLTTVVHNQIYHFSIILMCYNTAYLQGQRWNGCWNEDKFFGFYHFRPICPVLWVLWAICPVEAQACTVLPWSTPSCDFYGPMGHCTEIPSLFSWHKVCWWIVAREVRPGCECRG
jgi:hypothetical protein